MRKVLITATVLTVALSAGAACATKKYVQEQVGGVNTKVDTLGKGLEDDEARAVECCQRVRDHSA